MAYLISEEAKDLLRDVHEFCEKEVVEQSKEYDLSGEWPKELYDKAIDMQLQTLEIPKEYGGPGLSRIDVAALVEEMAIADAGFATTISASGLGIKPVLIAGNDAQKKHVADLVVNHGAFAGFCLTESGAGSDASAVKTTAVKDGDQWVINGTKCFITNGGVASFYCVVAMTDKSKGVKGLSMFLVDRDTPGVSTGKEENKMGIRLSNTAEVIFQDVRVPAENMLGNEGDGFKIAMMTLDQARAWMGCTALGIAQRAMNEAVAYGKQRIQFGKPVIKNQAMQFKVADMAIKIECGRQMVAHAFTLMDKKMPHTKEAAIAKCFASDTAMECATEAVQMFGGNGYMREYPVEKLMRDAKIFQIFEGTNEIQHIVIAGQVIGR